MCVCVRVLTDGVACDERKRRAKSGVQSLHVCSHACRVGAGVSGRVYMSDEVAAVKGDRARLCKRRLMGSLESLFSQSNEVHLPWGQRGVGGAGRNMKDRLQGSDRQPGHLIQPRTARWTRRFARNDSDSRRLPHRRLEGQPDQVNPPPLIECQSPLAARLAPAL